ncbi:MAG: hypothetical protein J6X69_07825 [Bacteroidales bacterium]|nr:hypothetical protein [Bacteroidales bacterium]MBP5539708.1 hypothetical protein [Bacteroidales bacterium]
MKTKTYEVPQCEELIIAVENVILYGGTDNGNAKAPNGEDGGYYGDIF